jgi:hypothetical protein
MWSSLFVVLLLLVILVVDLEVAELVGVLGRCHHAQPVPKVVLLQVLLRQVLKVALGERHRRRHDDLILLLGEGDVLAEVLGLSGNLDALLEVGLEVTAVHDAVLDGVRAVDGEPKLGLLAHFDAALALELLAAGTLFGLLRAGALLGCYVARHSCRMSPLLSKISAKR